MTNDATHAAPDDAVLTEIARELGERGYAVREDFFAPAFAERARDEIRALGERGDLRPAAVGRATDRAPSPEVRGDGTRWLEPAAPATPVEAGIAEALERLRRRLNETLFLGLWDWEGHFARYAPGTFYRRHLDRFRDESRRAVSVVFFFNPGWVDADEGWLRLELPEGERRIAPRAGTAVFFRSERIPHEVLPTRADRYSFAGWLRTRA